MEDTDKRPSRFFGASDFDSFLSHMHDIVVWAGVGPPTGDDPEFTYVSAGFEDIWGRSREALLEDNSILVEATHPEDRDRVRAVTSDPDHGTGDPDVLEHRIVRPDGEVRWVKVWTYIVCDKTGDPSHILGVTVDITERKQTERALQRKTERLEDLIRVISHDVRNPVAVAQGRLELVEATDGEEHLTVATEALERIETLLDDLLTVAHEGEQMEIDELVTLSEVAEDSWRAVKTKDATLDVATEQERQADRSRLQQLLENLIRNAVEHGGQGVTVTVGDLNDGFYVADDGTGIPEAERGNVLDTGYSTATEGTGFGLTIVKQIAEAHGWTVRLTESDAGGARFEFTDVQ